MINTINMNTLFSYKFYTFIYIYIYNLMKPNYKIKKYDNKIIINIYKLLFNLITCSICSSYITTFGFITIIVRLNNWLSWLWFRLRSWRLFFWLWWTSFSTFWLRLWNWSWSWCWLFRLFIWCFFFWFIIYKWFRWSWCLSRW